MASLDDDTVNATVGATAGYFGAAALYQAASGGNVVRMFRGSTTEQAVQVGGAIVAAYLMVNRF